MKPLKSQINLRVVNNTALPQPVSIMGIVANINTANNSNLLYEFNLTGQSFIGITNININISNTSNPTIVLYSAQVLTQSIQGVVDALNTLNQGLFFYSGNIVYVSSSYYIYGTLDVFSTTFVSTWNTSNTSVGSSANNQIQLPLFNGGTYNFTVHWGDGTSDVITSWNQAETLHTYTTSGVYTLNIIGTITEWSFGNALVDDKQKILSISNWGTLQIGTSTDLNFLNCVNLDLSTVADVLNLSNNTSLSNAFDGCTSLTTINRSNEWNTSNITLMNGLFANCTSFNSDISTWNVSNVSNLGGMFLNCQLFNSNISGWNVSQTINADEMFQGATAFNQNIGSWNLSNVTTMIRMFQGAIAFDQNIGSWDISNVTDFTNFMNGKSFTDYSASNLDAIYNGWSLLTVQPSININFGTIKYTLAGQGGRNILTGVPNIWIIADGGI
jgi:surface protein